MRWHLSDVLPRTGFIVHGRNQRSKASHFVVFLTPFVNESMNGAQIKKNKVSQQSLVRACELCWHMAVAVTFCHVPGPQHATLKNWEWPGDEASLYNTVSRVLANLCANLYCHNIIQELGGWDQGYVRAQYFIWTNWHRALKLWCQYQQHTAFVYRLCYVSARVNSQFQEGRGIEDFVIVYIIQC